MASARSIAPLILNFGLLRIPVRLYPASASASAISSNQLDKTGGRLKQQYVSERHHKLVPCAEMVNPAST